MVFCHKLECDYNEKYDVQLRMVTILMLGGKLLQIGLISIFSQYSLGKLSIKNRYLMVTLSVGIPPPSPLTVIVL